MKKEICWNITSRCNQSCKYCHRFLNIKELSFEENVLVLMKLIDQGVSEITWTGGEALMVNRIEKLLKIAYDNGIKNKIITNGIALTNEMLDTIIPFLDSLTLSIDSIDEEINYQLGRGRKHFDNINRILEYIKEKDYKLKIRINSVFNKINLNEIENLAIYLKNYNIFSWRMFKFLSLRETSVKNRKLFEISEKDFQKKVNKIKTITNIPNIDSRVDLDMEDKYILILADGSIVITKNSEDITIGNALTTDISIIKKEVLV